MAEQRHVTHQTSSEKVKTQVEDLWPLKKGRIERSALLTLSENDLDILAKRIYQRELKRTKSKKRARDVRRAFMRKIFLEREIRRDQLSCLLNRTYMSNSFLDSFCENRQHIWKSFKFR